MTTPPGYPQPPEPAYAPAPQYPARYPSEEKNWFGIASLVLSLVGLFTWVTAIPGIVFGHLSLSAARRGEASNRGLGLAGLIIGYVVVVSGILVGVALVLFLAAGVGVVASECGGSNPAAWCE